MLYRIVALIFSLLLYFPGIGSADSVGKDKARIVAQNWIIHCVSAYGSWDGVSTPTISGEETLMQGNEVVGFNFLISPKGNILVTARDDMPPVKLYSDTSTLSIHAENTWDISAWIADEISQIGKALDSHASDPVMGEALLEQNNPDVKAWGIFSDVSRFQREHRSYTAKTESLSIGPLVASTWAQADPYNQQCPLDSDGCRTIVGCVATAASQIMKYWSHPNTGSGSISYLWDNGVELVTLSRNFSSSTYDWVNMPNSLNSSSTSTQKEAVAKLCADVGIALQMDYGCNVSGAMTSDTPIILKTFFKYMNTANWVGRSDYISSSAWMQVFKNEVLNGRPSELRLRDPSAGGHAVVVDGYRDTPSETVHINMGWSGSYDGWYIPDSFTTGQFNWTDTSYQGAAIGIQPDTSPALEKSTILWANSDGTASLWNMDASGNIINKIQYGPYTDWTARGYHRNSDRTAQMLWVRADGYVSLWNLDAYGNITSKIHYGPYTDWTARSYHRNNDGTAQMLWVRTDGYVSLWNMDASGNIISKVKYGPYTDWTAASYDRNSDGTAHMLWVRTDGYASLWNMDAYGNIASKVKYGPYTDWSAKTYHQNNNSDGNAQMLWVRTDGYVSLWNMDASGNIISKVKYGPYSGWSAQDYDFDNSP